MEKIKKVLITKEGRKFYLRNLDSDAHTQYGYIKKSNFRKKDGSRLFSNTKKEFVMFAPYFADLYRKIKRDAQIIPLKDIGSIIAETGINKDSKVVDAGSGSGALACFLANIVKEVTTYELREDFIKVVKNNIEFLNLNNVKVKNKDIYKKIDEKNVDLVVLDVPEPWKALNSASRALRVGGFLASYSPTIVQATDLVNKAGKRKDYVHVKTKEIIEREWEIQQRKVRPMSRMLGHSGFLSFLRRV